MLDCFGAGEPDARPGCRRTPLASPRRGGTGGLHSPRQQGNVRISLRIDENKEGENEILGVSYSHAPLFATVHHLPVRARQKTRGQGVLPGTPRSLVRRTLPLNGRRKP